MKSAAELLMGDATGMAAAVHSGQCTATALVEASLERIAATDGKVNAFTALVQERALARAWTLDRSDNDKQALPLAGVPFAVKNLFDIQGLATLAGSKIERDSPPAAADALLVERLEAAGAVLVGALNMDEYAYGFTTENSHEGPVCNPHDTSRIAGGSSGGSAAAVAAGQVPLTLGSDTNGSIRVPASLCGVFGLKPTFGRLPRTRSYPFVSSLDHLGPFARSVRDLAVSYDAMQGFDAGDPGCARRSPALVSSYLRADVSDLRIGVLGGWFHECAQSDARVAVARVAQALGAGRTLELPLVEAGRAAAFLISNAEGAALHLPDLRSRAEDFEPLSRDRFLAGALLPAAWIARAQRVRLKYAEAVATVFEDYDILLAPSTPCTATTIGQETFEIEGRHLPVRPNMGLLTQPISCIGLPVCAVPVWGVHARLPIGVQVIGAPWREDLVLRVAAFLEKSGTVRAPVAAL
jgi:amidase/aspartyl-tRNA(Asn)/glutamyl-tRNA(Gln) amidotransferase subunit A